jgi:hypothetical protein
LALKHQLVQEDDIADFASLIDKQREIAATRSVIRPLDLIPADPAPDPVKDMDAAITLTQRVPGMKVWIPYASLDDVCKGGYFIREGRTVPVEEVRVQNRCPTTQPR